MLWRCSANAAMGNSRQVKTTMTNAFVFFI